MNKSEKFFFFVSILRNTRSSFVFTQIFPFFLYELMVTFGSFHRVPEATQTLKLFAGPVSVFRAGLLCVSVSCPMWMLKSMDRVSELSSCSDLMLSNSVGFKSRWFLILGIVIVTLEWRNFQC